MRVLVLVFCLLLLGPCYPNLSTMTINAASNVVGGIAAYYYSGTQYIAAAAASNYEGTYNLSIPES